MYLYVLMIYILIKIVKYIYHIYYFCLVAISHETRRGWAIAEEMRGLMASYISEFVHSKNKLQRSDVYLRLV